jgi:glycosyltransferase involved in cell wall biosynthesis
MDKPLVSVIIPVKNGEDFLSDAINSILNQDYSSVEIIVVDGQSTDDTAQIAKSFKQIRYVYQHQQPGIPYAKNLGIEIANGEFIAFASHDDLWLPQKISKQIDYMINNSQVQYTITKVKFFLETGCTIPPGFNIKLLKGDYVGKMPETLVARKSLFNLIGVFNTGFTYMEDIDWFNRADLNKIPAVIIDEVLLHKRIHNTNVSYDSVKNQLINREIISLLKKSIERNPAGLVKNNTMDLKR